MIIPSLLAPMPPKIAATQIEGFRRFGPLFFVAYCLLILLFSPGDKAFAFTPAEVSFLFPGPFSRRSLLAYKIGGNLASDVPVGLLHAVRLPAVLADLARGLRRRGAGVRIPATLPDRRDGGRAGDRRGGLDLAADAGRRR